jgi:hypothetical protein
MQLSYFDIRAHTPHPRGQDEDIDWTWEMIKKYTYGEMIEAKEYWKKFTYELDAHSSCKMVDECITCGQMYCLHMKDRLYHRHSTCAACDFQLHPNPYNPKNADLVIYYGVEPPQYDCVPEAIIRKQTPLSELLPRGPHPREPMSINSLKSVDELWSYVREKPGYVKLDMKKIWSKFERDSIAHASCQEVLHCGDCKRGYCKHMTDEVSNSYSVCTDCDWAIRPNPYNPKNADLIAHYNIYLP